MSEYRNNREAQIRRARELDARQKRNARVNSLRKGICRSHDCHAPARPGSMYCSGCGFVSSYHRY